ncbi:hypothetical protein G7072_09205 [Nocardioides sp. HDW12B]|uniref:hypothetical protein n=1 Tax=Nocardioides sp. HDW12B TaxID=2714939 RepID=UPI001408B58A|nr:hypothetical protein [Nocardioides sp. HDW12B]QIK66504.1 hypothetical protein G7072_09205 [Nocardioides sp. HDW12B]
MLPATWIECRRTDGERVGWAVPAGEGFHAVDLLGRRRTETPLDWLETEETLTELGIGYLADRYHLTLPSGETRVVRIGEAGTSGIVVVADELGAASAVGAEPDTFDLPFPAPPTLTPAG